MPDRIIRDELLESDRWLDLDSDAARLAFVGFLLVCDDFGNFEGGRRIFRLLNKFTSCKSEAECVAVIKWLEDSDLIRKYKEGERELFHIPRFRPHRQYLVRKMPASPWDDDRILGKNRTVLERGLAKNQSDRKNLHTNKRANGRHMAEGVGVGVGVGVGKNNNKRAEPFTLPDWIPAEHWNAWIEARTKRRNPPTDYAKRLVVRRLENFKKKGDSPALVLMQSAIGGWANVFPLKPAK